MHCYSLMEFADSEAFPFQIQRVSLEEDFSVHTHDFSELVIVTRGKARHIENSESYPIEEGDVFIVEGASRHGYAHVQNFELWNIMYKPQQILPLTEELHRLDSFKELFLVKRRNTDRRIRLNKLLLPRIRHILTNMLFECDSMLKGYQSLTMANFIRLLVFISRENEYQSEPRASVTSAYTSDRVIYRIMMYIEEHYHEDLKIEELAAMAFLSSRHFTRRFKAKCGIGPKEYILLVRLARAMNLIRIGGNSITRIALDCGFNDSNYFTRLFKLRYGKTPRDIKRFFDS